ncbi:hypothetical protein ACKWRH_05800 [Bradyrhizobium sp. Pa8]
MDLHAIAWHEAMAKFGHDVGFEQAQPDRKGRLQAHRDIPVG